MRRLIRTRDRRSPAATTARCLLLLAPMLFSACGASKQLGSGNAQGELVIVYQPSHQSDTGVNFNEALVSNAIVEAAMAASTGVAKVYKVWSYNVEGVHHAWREATRKLNILRR